jgi:hypothetical protein
MGSHHILRKAKAETNFGLLRQKKPPVIDRGICADNVRVLFFGIVNKINRSDFPSSAISTQGVFQSKIFKTRRLGIF